MFGRKKEIKITKLSDLQKAAKDLPACVNRNLKTVEKMDKKTYLKYYISVLEKQIIDATKILREKKTELRKLI